MIIVVVIILIIIIAIVAILAILARRSSNKKAVSDSIITDNVANISNEARESSWRLRWFIISGDDSIRPFEWIVNRFHQSTREKINDMFNNKLYQYKCRLRFESESDIADSELALTTINTNISSHIDPTRSSAYYDNMNALDRCIFSQYDHINNNQYKQCNDDLDNCGIIVNRLINIV